MVKSFKGKITVDIYNGVVSKRARRVASELHATAARKIDLINGAADLNDLLIPPGNMLEALKGNLKGYFSIRINQQWRIIFRWNNGDAHDVEIVDYHK